MSFSISAKPIVAYLLDIKADDAWVLIEASKVCMASKVKLSFGQNWGESLIHCDQISQR